MSDYPIPRRTIPAVAFDLDGTLAVDTWPEPHIGEPIPAGIEALEHYFDQGFAIKIYTARPRSHAPAIVKWLELVGVGHMVYDVVTDKPLADLYIDDRAWNPPWANTAAPEEGHDTAPEREPDEEYDPDQWTVVG